MYIIIQKIRLGLAVFRIVLLSDHIRIAPTIVLFQKHDTEVVRDEKAECCQAEDTGACRQYGKHSIAEIGTIHF